MKLFEKFDDDRILERLKSWKQNDSVFDELYRKVNNKNLCTACGHDGKITTHTKNGWYRLKNTNNRRRLIWFCCFIFIIQWNRKSIENCFFAGCLQCGTRNGCDETVFKEERVRIKNELNMRSKALADPDFPNYNLVKEFLVRKDNVSGFNLKWKQPDMLNFVVSILFQFRYL